MRLNQKFFKTFILLLGLGFSAGNVLLAQVSCGGLPPSFKGAATLPEKMSLNIDFDVEELRLKSEVLQRESNNPPFIAKSLPVSLDMTNSGNWSSSDEGKAVWQLRIEAPDALALLLAYDQFYIPEGGELYIYSADKSMVLGAYTSITNPRGGSFSTEMVAGDDIVLEYVSPFSLREIKKASNADQLAQISIENVGYVFDHVVVKRFPNKGAVSTEIGESSECMININCSEGDNWQEVKKGVVQMLMYVSGASGGAGWYVCTGSLMNNTAQDLTPYILSAYHCYEGATSSDLSKWQFTFGYEAPGCEDATPEDEHTLVGSYLRAATPIEGGSDGLLLELAEDIPSDWDVYYNGWDRTNAEVEGGGVGIHHPAGDIKKISTFESYEEDTWPGESIGATNAHWEMTFVSTANGHSVTEGGSSGSPIFNSNKLVFGTLTGGNSSCTNTSGSNYYGKLWYHWDQYGDDTTTQMKSYLDPLGLDLYTFEGTSFDPSAPRITAAAQVVDVKPTTELNVAGETDTLVITGANLTERITVEVSGPFEVSSDQVFWTASTKIAMEGGELYIHYLPTEIGMHTGVLTLTSADANTYYINLNSSSCPDISFDFTSIPAGTIYNEYSTTISVSNASTSDILYEITNGTLPGGLSLDESTGVISGTSQQGGDFDFTIVATDDNGCFASYDYSLSMECTSISAFPFVEDFEYGMSSCWDEVVESGDISWTVQTGGYRGGQYPAAAYSGSYNLCYRSESYADNSNYYVTPALEVSALANPVLSFAHAQAKFFTDQDELEVYYKTSVNGSWNLLAAYTNDISDWTLENIALSDVSATYYVGFHGTAGFGRGIVLDRVMVSSPVLSAYPEKLVGADFEETDGELIANLTVSGTDLSEGITLSGGTDLSFSEDQETWSTSLLLEEDGGSVYVKYTDNGEELKDTIWLISTATRLAVPIASQATAINVNLASEQSYTVNNPFSNSLQLSLNTAYTKVEVHDVMGRLVYSRNVTEQENNLIIQTEQWPAGVYTLRVSNDNTSLNQKLVKP